MTEIIEIVESKPIYGHYVTIKGTEVDEYIRISTGNWMVRIGESFEPVWDCTELDKLFKEHVHRKVIEAAQYD